MEICGRPNRSDAHLPMEEAAKIEEKTREYFDGVVPKRHSKPQRSEYASKYLDAISADYSIPELSKFQNLENDTQKLMYNGTDVPEEFVETEYYKDLICVDKQHHTTGTGFIKVENSNGKSFSLEPDNATEHHSSCKGNPATNDWIPAAADAVDLTSGKPNRSEN